MSTRLAERPLEALGLQVEQGGPAPRWSGQPWHARLLDTLSSYLSLLLMALLALGSWWLVKNTPIVEVPRTTAPPTHEPDYTMRRFQVQRFTQQGTLRAQIEGEELRHFPDTDTFEIDNPKVRTWSDDGKLRSEVPHDSEGRPDGTGMVDGEPVTWDRGDRVTPP